MTKHTQGFFFSHCTIDPRPALESRGHDFLTKMCSMFFTFFLTSKTTSAMSELNQEMQNQVPFTCVVANIKWYRRERLQICGVICNIDIYKGLCS